MSMQAFVHFACNSNGCFIPVKILKKIEEHSPELTILLEKQRTLTQVKVSVISNATDVINCLSSQYEHSIAAIKVAIDRELVSDSSCKKSMSQ